MTRHVCGARLRTVQRGTPDANDPETWPVLVCRRHGIVGAIPPTERNPS